MTSTIGRRTFLQGSAFTAATFALLTRGTTLSSAQQSNTLRIALSTLKGETLDPAQGHPEKVLKLPLYDYLVGADREGRNPSTETGLATKWEQADDGLSWKFTIRPGIAWQKGNGTVTAEDVAFTLNRLNGPDIDTANARYFKVIKEANAVDHDTVVVSLVRRAVELPIMLSPLHQTEGMILPKAYYEKVGRDGFRREPVGSGPYEFVSRTSGKNIVFRSVGKHWSFGQPRYQTLDIQQVPEDTTRIAMLQKGDVNLIDLPRRSYSQLKGNPKITVAPRVGDSSYTVWFPSQLLDGPFTNEQVRAALGLAIDRSQVIKLFGGNDLAKIATQTSPCGSWNPVCQDLKPDAYDPDLARKMLKDAGQASFEIEIQTTNEFPEQQDVSESLASFWQAIGLKAKVVPMEFATWRTMSIQKKLPPTSAVAHEVPNSIISAGLMTAFYSKASPMALGTHPDLEPVMKEITGAPTFEAQGKYVQEAARIIFERHLELPLVQSGQVIAFDATVHDKGLGGRQFVDFGLREILTET
jgi:peptide/nickel transport system substrate-binding protein